jgi:hypothetical protein
MLWNDWPVEVASFEALTAHHAEGSLAHFIWEEERHDDGLYLERSGQRIEVQPLAVDALTLNMLFSVCETLDEPNQEKFRCILGQD